MTPRHLPRARATGRLLTTLLATAVLTVTVLALPPAAGASSTVATPTWAPASSATIRPGVQTFTAGAQCTANFVFHDGTDVYIGQAAHCSGTGGSTETNGCQAGSRPLDTPVEISGATRPGTMVYNSWLAMQAAGGASSEACAYNDFALIRIDPADHGRVNPTIPFFGGPTGLTASVPAGSRVLSYGNSSLRFGLTALSPKEGTSLGQSPGGWTHTVYTATPGVPGDSGSAFIDGSGLAFGVLSTVAIAPLAGSNGVSDLSRALQYLQSQPGFGSVQLALGTEPFTGGRL